MLNLSKYSLYDKTVSVNKTGTDKRYYNPSWYAPSPAFPSSMECVGFFGNINAEWCGGRGHFQYSIIEKKKSEKPISRGVYRLQDEFIKKKKYNRRLLVYITKKKKTKKTKTTEKIVKSLHNYYAERTYSLVIICIFRKTRKEKNKKNANKHG